MIDFLRENWRLILEAILVIASFVFCLIRKKPLKISDTLKSTILSLLPGFIALAEKSGFKGADKLAYVLSLVKNSLASEISDAEFNERYKAFIVSQVEAILYCPQKKEVKDEK